MLTDVSQTSEISINGWGSCDLTLLVVGGGGRGSTGYGGGAGSGYLEYRSLQVSAGSLMTAQVGDQRQSSSVTISGGDTITAHLGEDGQGDDGGSGYSGGGGWGSSSGYGGDGGSDGGMERMDPLAVEEQGLVKMSPSTPSPPGAWARVQGDKIIIMSSTTGEEEGAG